jgi:hypothetical protein
MPGFIARLRDLVKLIEALEELKKPLAENAPCFRGALACGFTPLHFETLLGAHLRKRLPGKRVRLDTGPFGDLRGNLERLHKAPIEVLVVIIEWQDLDSRLGIRTLGGWRTTDLPEIVNSTAQAIGSKPARSDARTKSLRSLVLKKSSSTNQFNLNGRRWTSGWTGTS